MSDDASIVRMKQTASAVLEKMMSLDQIADRMGVARSSVQVFHRRARKAREHDLAWPDEERQVKPSDMPPPDLETPRSPMWHADTIETWLKARRPYKRKALAEV
jgi:transposase